MDIRTLGVWASFSVQVASGAATVNPDYQWVAVPIFWSATALLVICICLWLRSNWKPFFGLVARVEPIHLIILALALALVAAIWYSLKPKLIATAVNNVAGVSASWPDAIRCPTKI